jgi:hypothetical protein
MSNPNPGLNDEIDNQDVESFYAGNAYITLSLSECIASYLLGDTGHFCTLTVECQKSCTAQPVNNG